MSDKIYKSGWSFKFDPEICQKCGGKCCIGESGYIWVKKEEIKKLAKLFGLSFDEFASKFLQKIGTRFTIKEKPFEDGLACVFFDENSRNCSVYELRPLQCRTFPFWEHFRGNFDELERECIGVSLI